LISGSGSTTRRLPARFLAGFRRHSYLGAGILGLALGCGHPAGVTPAGAFRASSREEFLAAALATLPAGRQIVRLSWHFEGDGAQYAGSGAARIAPPDSLRADIAATFGLGRATIILTGDSVVARPAQMVDQVLPDRFALWAILGIVKVPPGDVRIEAARDGERSLWRTTDAAGRATVFELNGGALTGVSRLEGDRVTSQLRLTRGPDGAVNRADLTDVVRGLRFAVSITGRENSGAFLPEVWRLDP
jgi:hypothetical protein